MAVTLGTDHSKPLGQRWLSTVMVRGRGLRDDLGIILVIILD